MTIASQLQPLCEHNKTLIPPRKVQVQRAGGLYRARFEGDSESCFGITPNEATKRLKFWGDRGYA
jgi:hypothetical protein